MKVSIIIPVYNEGNNIKIILDRVMEAKTSGISHKEIIIVNDGSTDNTLEVLEGIKKTNGNGMKVINLTENKGKGRAIREGLKYVTGDIVIMQDGDLEYDPDDYNKLLKEIISGGNEVVYGSRTLNKDNRSCYFVYSAGGRFLSWLANLLYNSHLTDMPTGYKVFRADVLKGIRLKCEGFEFCPEITAKILKKGIKIMEVPIKYSPRKMSEGKKIRWHEGFIAAWTMLKYRIID